MARALAPVAAPALATVAPSVGAYPYSSIPPVDLLAASLATVGTFKATSATKSDSDDKYNDSDRSKPLPETQKPKQNSADVTGR